MIFLSIGLLGMILEAFTSLTSLILLNLIFQILRENQSLATALQKTEEIFSLPSFPLFSPQQGLFFISLYFFSLFFLQNLQNLYWSFLVENFVHKKRLLFFSFFLKSQHIPSRNFVNQLGSLFSELGFSLLHLVQNVGTQILKIFFLFLLLSHLNGKWSLFFLFFLMILFPFFYKRLKNVEHSAQSVLSHQSDFLLQFWQKLKRWELIRSFQQERKILEEVKVLQNHLLKKSQVFHFKKAFFSPFLEFSLFLGLIAFLLWFLQNSLSLSSSLPRTLNQFTIMTLIIVSFKTLASGFMNAQKGLGNYHNLKNTSFSSPKIHPHPFSSFKLKTLENQIKLSHFQGNLTSFTKRVQQQGNELRIQKGSFLLLSGPSGVGKTQFLKELASQLQSQGVSFSYSPQEPWIYENSVLKTLTYPHFKNQTKISFSPFLPNTKNPQSWSRGEKASLNFLRHLHLNKEVWLLDESFASLDEGKASSFHQILQNGSWSYCFFVTHQTHLFAQPDGQIHFF